MTRAEQIAKLLERKTRNDPGSYAWLHDAVELLLRVELERQTDADNRNVAVGREV